MVIYQMVCTETLSSEDFGFFHAAGCTVGNVFSDVLFHTLPVILVFYKTVGVSGSLMT